MHIAQLMQMVHLMPLPRLDFNEARDDGWQCHPIISSFIEIQTALTFLVPAYPVVLEKRPSNGCLPASISIYM